MKIQNYSIVSCINYSNSGPDWENANVWDEGYTLTEAQEMVEYLNERDAGFYCYKVV